MPRRRIKILLRAALIGAFLGAALGAHAVEETWVYAVRLSALVQADPPRIELNWPADPHPVSGYTVFRKAPAEAAWGAGTDLPPWAGGYVDEAVTVGTPYEYQVIKHASFPHNGPEYKGYGYISTGINLPLVEQRGRVILLVEASVAGPLAPELGRLERDLQGDGWTVARHDVPRDESPARVRALIQGEYAADRERTTAVFLLGHIPVVRSGNLNVDGHQARPMPADVFYGDIDGEWTDANGDGILDPSVLPSNVELQVGRVDFANLTGESVHFRFPTEIELLQRYLDKNHAYRHAAVRPAMRALIANPIGDGSGQAYAASGYRNFAVLVGAGNIQTVDAQLDTPLSERFVTALSRNDYLWVYGCGAGSDFEVNTIGANGAYNGLWSSDFIQQRAKGTFYQFFGSWFADWSKRDNLMRGALTAPEYGLAASWSGRPHHYFHSMGTGETIGHGIRLSQNNDGTLYQNHVQRQLRGVHIALLGDPTLRMNMLAPPTGLAARQDGFALELAWTASADPVLGYHVYRAVSGGGAFTRLNADLVSEARFVDAEPPGTPSTYMVRAVGLQVGPSGSYYNASQGAFISGPAKAEIAARMADVPELGPKPADIVWFDDMLPAGSVAFASDNDRWNWVASNPSPISGALAHQAENAAGLHHHFFAFAETPLVVGEGDTLFAYVHLDPANPPRQLMLTWLAGDWEHRAYWGENLIAEGADATAARRHIGPLPPTGRWVRLEIPASAVAMENQAATGMGFTLFDGRATWDRTGKSRP